MVLKPKDTHARSIAKAVSWRITGSVDTFVVSYFITGKFVLAGSIAGIEFLTKIVLFYLHERAWVLVPFGQR
jgi:uncharacterized membrane protein